MGWVAFFALAALGLIVAIAFVAEMDFTLERFARAGGRRLRRGRGNIRHHHVTAAS
jgi:hypothetical protein